MSDHLVSETYRATVFMGDALQSILFEVVRWLNHTTPSGKLHGFYFVDMSYNYDAENGSSITVWHGELL